MVHNLKTRKCDFTEFKVGDRRFEARPNNRSYKAGDIVIFHEYNFITKEYSGNYITKRVEYIIYNRTFIKNKIVVMAVKDIEN